MIAAALNAPSPLLAVATIVAVFVALRARLRSAAALRELDAMQHEAVDPLTGLLPQTAIGLRLEPELQWAQRLGVPVGVVVLRPRGNDPVRAARALRRAMRGEEHAYLLGDDQVVLGLWNTGEAGVLLAIRRLSAAMRSAGREVIDAGYAMFPRDGTDLELVVGAAVEDLRPADTATALPGTGTLEFAPVDQVAPERTPSAAHTAQVARLIALPVTAALASLVAVYAVWHPGVRGALALLALTPAIACAVTWGWWTTRTWEPVAASRSAARSLRALTLAVTAAGVLLLVPALAGWTSDLADVALLTWMVALVLTPLMPLRLLVRGRGIVPLGVALLGAAVVAVTWRDLELVANVGRIAVAAGAGALVARVVERLWWVLPIALAIAAVDTWSVLASAGTTNQLDDASGGVLDTLLFVGPPLDHPAFSIGVVDLLFVAGFLGISHLWRLSVPRTYIALVLATGCAFAVGALTDEPLPALPFLAVGFVVAHGRALVDETRDALGDRDGRPLDADPTSAGSAPTD